METIIYILKKRSKYFLDKENQGEHILILLNIFAFSYIPKVLQKPFQLSDGTISPSALYLINAIILLAPLLSLFFPSFEAKKNMLPGYLPTAKWKLFFLDFLTSLGKRPSLSIIAMTAGFFFYFHFGSFGVMLSIFLTGLISLMLIDAITNVLTWRKHHWWAVIAGSLALNLLPKWIRIDLNTLLFLKLATVILLGVTVWKTYLTSPPSAKSPTITKPAQHNSLRSILLKVITRHNMAVKAIILVFILKIVILFGMPYFGESYHKGSPLPATFLLFYSPLFLFASIFNNSFGYFRELFWSVWLFNNRPIQYMRLFLPLLLPFLLLDTVLSMTFLIWFKIFTWQNILTYVSATLYLIIVAILSSCLLPKKIEEKTLSGRQKNTSTWSSLVSMMPLLAIIVLHLKQAYPIQLACLVLAGLTLIIFIKYYSAHWQEKVIHSLK